MGRRSRARAKEGGATELRASTSEYSDEHGNVLTLRGALTPGTRREYADTLAGEGRAAATKEDNEQRSLELLFERLAVRWTISGVPIERTKELLLRLRAGTTVERAWIRQALREHCAEWFPDVRVP